MEPEARPPGSPLRAVPCARGAVRRLARFFEDPGNHSRAGGRQLERGLVGFELDDFLIALDRIADRLAPRSNHNLSDGFADLGNFQFDWHGSVSAKRFIQNPLLFE